MKVEALTFDRAKQLIQQQEEMNVIAEEEKRTATVPARIESPEVIEAEVIEPLSSQVELPENRGWIENWWQRIGIESNNKLLRAFNDGLDQVFRARNTNLDMLRQDEELEQIRRESELAKIDHMIALKERRIRLDFLHQIETAKNGLILATVSRMIEEHKSETRLHSAKANARAREYEDE